MVIQNSATGDKASATDPGTGTHDFNWKNMLKGMLGFGQQGGALGALLGGGLAGFNVFDPNSQMNQMIHGGAAVNPFQDMLKGFTNDFGNTEAQPIKAGANNFSMPGAAPLETGLPEENYYRQLAQRKPQMPGGSALPQMY